MDYRTNGLGLGVQYNPLVLCIMKCSGRSVDQEKLHPYNVVISLAFLKQFSYFLAGSHTRPARGNLQLNNIMLVHST